MPARARLCNCDWLVGVAGGGVAVDWRAVTALGLALDWHIALDDSCAGDRWRRCAPAAGAHAIEDGIKLRPPQTHMTSLEP